MQTLRQKTSKPNNFFPQFVVNQNQSFIKTLNREEIITYRRAYVRELNSSTEKNELPEPTVEQRRCFLYLTS